MKFILALFVLGILYYLVIHEVAISSGLSEAELTVSTTSIQLRVIGKPSSKSK
jgi:hypothetical protein